MQPPRRGAHGPGEQAPQSASVSHWHLAVRVEQINFAEKYFVFVHFLSDCTGRTESPAGSNCANESPLNSVAVPCRSNRFWRKSCWQHEAAFDKAARFHRQARRMIHRLLDFFSTHCAHNGISNRFCISLASLAHSLHFALHSGAYLSAHTFSSCRR